jgi:opacity protein-like surface antigen
MIKLLPIITMATFSLLSPITHAGVMGDDIGSDNYNSVYLGVDIGIADLIDSESTVYPPTSHQLSAAGIVGGGLVGYDFTLYDNLKLGVEGFINANDLNIAARQYLPTPLSYTLQARYNAGVRLLPCWELSPGTIGHALLGYANIQLSLQDNGNYGYINQNLNKSGFQCGLGAKTNIFNSLWLRADALYTYYGTLNSIGANNTQGYAYQTYSNIVSTVEGDITLLYQFN